MTAILKFAGQVVNVVAKSQEYASCNLDFALCLDSTA